MNPGTTVFYYGTCCGCGSRNARRTVVGTFYCKACAESAREFIERVREREAGR